MKITGKTKFTPIRTVNIYSGELEGTALQLELPQDSNNQTELKVQEKLIAIPFI